MDESDTKTRRPRSDKIRNRTRILDVAERFFTEQGVGGSMENIAKQAGIGPATLYRHFPTREALLAALMEARHFDAVAHREAIETSEHDPVVALERWMDALGEYATAFDGLPDPLRAALSEDSSPLATTCEWFITTTDHFLDAVKAAGRARATARGRDLFLSALATAWAQGATLADESSGQSLRSLVRDGWLEPVSSPTTASQPKKRRSARAAATPQQND